MASSADLKIGVSADTNQASSGLRRLADQISGLGKSTHDFTIGLNTLSLAFKSAHSIASTFVAVGKEVAATYAVQEQAEARLQATLKATGNQIGMSTSELYAMASAFQDVTTFGDETILGVQKVLIATKSLTKDGLKDAVGASLDLAAAMGTDAESAATQLAKALSNPTEGLNSLSRAGLKFTEEEKDRIKALQESNKLSEAQAEILKKVEGAYGGIAENLAQTDTGKLQQISNVWGDIKEGIGQGLLDTISPALDTLYSKLVNISDWVNRNVGIKEIQKAWKSGATDYSEFSDIEVNKFFDKLYGDSMSAYGEWIYNKNTYGDDDYRTNDAWNAYQEARTNLEPISAEYNRRLVRDAALVSAPATVSTSSGTAASSSSDSGSPATIEKFIPDPEAIARAEKFEEDNEKWLARLTSDLDATNAKIQEQKDEVEKTRVNWSKYAMTVVSAVGDLQTALVDNMTSAWENQASSLEKTLSKMKSAWEDYYNDVKEKNDLERKSIRLKYETGQVSAEEYMDTITSLYQEEQDAKEAEQAKEEELEKKADKLKEKAFETNKVNSIAQALINGAQAITNLWATNPWQVAAALTPVLATTNAVQVATISSQRYTGLASGGIVTSPTYTLLGEGGSHEAVLPLDKIDKYMGGGDRSSGTINLTVNVEGGAGTSSDISESVFYGIERAQRTGLLPRWQFA